MTSFHFILAGCHGTLAKRRNVMTLLKNGIIKFKTSGLKGNFFLNILSNDLSDIEPSYTKGELWIESFGFSNSLCTWAITNHVLIGEYQLHFFPREEFSCLCGLYSIKTRYHILYNCKRFNKGWNLWKETLLQFIFFLEYNLNKLAILLWL